MHPRLETAADSARELFFRVAASGVVPARLFLPSLPSPASLAAPPPPLSIEIVSHCWNYAHLLAYQLTSLVENPPHSASVTMTVFYSPEDERTAALLGWFGSIDVPGVEWNWQPIDRRLLFRRSIGRNLAALATRADWVWFTDCDVVFHRNCLDSLAAALEGRREILVHPAEEWTTPLLPDDHPLLLAAAAGPPRTVGIDPSLFSPRPVGEAKGPMQITHGDVARAAGYCSTIPIYQKPADRWRKAHEDRAFRWLLRTDGTALPIDGVYRIRHATKGRYADPRIGRLRRNLRRAESSLYEWWLKVTSRRRKR
jgi:hypothetical protein